MAIINNYDASLCGGSILSQTVIVTAAHCVSGISLQYLSVRAGSTYVNSGGYVLQVASATVNSGFSFSTMKDDIALAVLSGSLTYSASIQPIALPSQGYMVPVGTNTQVTGWGALYSGGSASVTLQVVTVPVTTKLVCDTANGLIYPITDNVLCAGLTLGGKDACQVSCW